MDNIEKLVAQIPKEQRDMPVTLGMLGAALAKVLETTKALKHRNDALEQRIRQLETRQ